MSKYPITLCLALCLIAGIVFTWPLATGFFSSIPYTLRPIPGFERVPMMPGDHLQSYYWYWLFSDNLFGHSTFFTNPYEFNGPSGPMSTVYANFPFSILYVLFLPLGQIGAYNALILLSFILCGLSMFLLARTWTNDPWAALMAGLIFAVVPYRVSQIAGGQLPGYVIFLLPLCLYFAEQILASGRWIYGGAAGISLVLLSLMDPHTSYLTALTLGVYLPSRILLIHPFPIVQTNGVRPIWPGLWGTLAGGVSFAAFLWIRFSEKANLPIWHPDLVYPFFLGPLFFILSWFYLSAFFARTTTLSFSEARHRIGRLFFLFLPLCFYALKYQLNVSRVGLILFFLCSGLFSAFLIILWIKNRERHLMLNKFRLVLLVTSLGLGLTIASVYLMHQRTTVYLPSLAGKGRTIFEVLLFSPRIGNLFFWQDINQERFVLLGWGLVLLALLGLMPLLKNRPEQPGKPALCGMLAFFAVILTLGPRLVYFPFYHIFYQYIPFFNYSRVPGRFVMIGMIFLCLLAGMALSFLRESLASKGWNGLRKWLPLLIIPLVLAEYHTWQPVGLSRLGGETRIYNQIEKGLSRSEKVLELPIWPGDSHQSSVYEYNVTRTRKPMINGYAPVVFRDYIQQVFWPLFPLDFGQLNLNQALELKKLKVDLVTFHDNSLIYPEKISPFPPRLALKRLMASPFLKLVDQEQDISLFKFSTSEPSANSSLLSPGMKRDYEEKAAAITSPVSAVFYAQNLSRETGKMEFDPSASGYYLLMEEKFLNQGRLVPRSGGRGNVASATPGQDQPGYMAVGTPRFFPSGKYKARFRIKTSFVDPGQTAGRIEILKDKTTLIRELSLSGRDMAAAADWKDMPLEFEISDTRQIGFRLYFSGKVPLKFNTAVIDFTDNKTGPGLVEAEDLLRQTGAVVPDRQASGHEAVLGKAGYHPPVYLCYGPYRTFQPGGYRAEFFLRLKDLPQSKDTKVALLEVATDMGKRVFSQRLVKVRDLRADVYQPIRLDFNIPFLCELGYRVKFLGKTDVLIDRIEVSGFRKAESKR